jgi:putative ABC transport system permease protein
MELQSEVVNGLISLAEGRWIEASDRNTEMIPLVISSALAEKNALNLGDVMDFKWEEADEDAVLEHFELEKLDERKISGEIVGIFQVDRSIQTDINEWSLENTIFSSLNFWTELFSGTRFGDYSYQYATFHLENALLSEAVLDQVMNLNLNWDRYELVDASEMLSRMSASFGAMEQLSGMMFVAVLAGGFAILSLIFATWIRNRHHEIAILLAVGTEKRKIFGQFIFESFSIALIAFGLAVVSLPAVTPFIDVGNLTAGLQPEETFYMEVDGEMIALDSSMVQTMGGESQESVIENQFFEQATTSITVAPIAIIRVLGALISLILVALLCSMIPVLKMKPKAILTRAH